MSEDRRRETWSFTKLIVWISKSIKDLATSPTITAGSAVPTAAEVNGSFYLRTNGTTYNRTGGAWVATVNNSTVLASTANGEGASLIGVEDAAGYYTGTDDEAVLVELGVQIGGDTSTAYNFTEANVLVDDTAVYACLEALDLKWGDLASVANGEGASLVAIEDAGGLYTATDTEAALAEVKPLADAALPQMVEVADPGDAAAIPVTASADIQMTTGIGAETGGLADPTAVGLTLHLRLAVDGGGDRVITADSGVNAAGNTSLTFADAGDSLILMSTRDGAASYSWRVVQNDGVTLA